MEASMKALILALIPTLALSGETVTREQWQWDLRNDTDGKPINGADGKPVRTKTEDECKAAGDSLRAYPFRCTTTVRYTSVPNCDGVPKPALTTFTVLEADAVIYKGPYCAPGETCTTPADWDVRSFTYTDVGGLRMNDDGTTDEYVLVNTNQLPACWEWQWKRVPGPEPVAQEFGEYPPLEADAFDAERETGG